MNIKLGGRIIVLTTTLLLTVTPLASADTPNRSLRDSQIFPYLLDNPHQNSVVRVRCLPKFRQERDRKRSLIRDTLLTPAAEDNQTITIEIEGNCRRFRILPEDYHYFDEPVEHHESGDTWLTRKGSGWHWLLRNQR